MAAGLDKYRADPSLLVWDVTRPIPESVYSSPDKFGSSIVPAAGFVDGAKLGRPLQEYGKAQYTHTTLILSSIKFIYGCMLGIILLT